MGSPLDDSQRAIIREMLARGLPSAHIARQLSLRTMQVAAVKAHITMGSYDEAPRPSGVGPRPEPRRATSVGIDIAEARKGLDLVALDSRRNVLVTRGRLSVNEAIEMTLQLGPSVVCIDSPSSWATSGRSRLAERQLAKIGIQAYRTPSDPGDHAFYGWMRVGFEVFAQLADRFPVYRGGRVSGTAAEIFPHATACLLAGELRSPSVSKEHFRRRALTDHGVSERELRTLDGVDAALGALTGLIALDGRHAAVGNPTEGVILLPVENLPATPLRAGAATTSARHVKRAYRRMKKSGNSLDFEKAAAFIAAVPPGKWTSYGDVAAAAGNRAGAQAIGMWALRRGHEIRGVHRVIRSNGFVAEGFRAAGPGVPPDAPAARHLLQQEGVGFDERGRASQEQRVTPDG
jgi:alkylated DNA nucleotide flippase Atl1/predicted nuclease with RNAse H fold